MNNLLEVSKSEEDGGNLVGKNPLEVSAQDWEDSNNFNAPKKYFSC